MKNARAVTGGDVKFHVCFLTTANSASLACGILIGQLEEKPGEGCQKDVKKVSKRINWQQRIG